MGGAYLAQSLRQLGHDVVTFGPGGDINSNHPAFTGHIWRRLAGFEPDILLYCDDGNLPLLLDPEGAPCSAIYYSIDTYCNPWHVCYAHGFDLVLVAQKDFVEIFANEKIPSVWFPLFYPGISLPELGSETRDIPVSFVGTLGHKNNPQRAPFLREFRRMHPLFFLSGNYQPIFSRSQIVLNQTAFSEVNFRCFEAMAYGAALLMEQCCNGLLDLFAPGENILPPYPRNNARVAAAIAKTWLDRPEALAEIGRAGRRLIEDQHTAVARAATLVEECGKLLGSGVDRAKLAAARRPLVRAAFGIIAAELTAPELEEYRKFYLYWGQG